MSRVIQTMDSQVAPPTVKPFDSEWAKAHIKALTNSEDELIESWIVAATQYFEEQTGRQVMAATWEYWLDGFPAVSKIELPHPPLRDVLAVEYVDGNGDTVGFTDGGSPEVVSWQSRAPRGVTAGRGWVELKSGLTWPTPRVEAGSVRVRYTAGYAETAGEVPELVRACLCLLMAHFEQFRSEVHLAERSSKLEKLPLGAEQIMLGFKYTAMPRQVLTCL